MLNKQPVSINFSKGIQTKSDPYQIPLGSFQTLKNSVFTKAGRLTKRNGFANITDLPNSLNTTITTLNDNLIATGAHLYAYNQDNNIWYDKGNIQPVQLSTQSLIRASTGQSAADSAIAPNGLVCLVYLDTDGNYYYQMSDSVTGERVVNRVALGAGVFDPRVNVLGKYYIITYMILSGGINHLRYLAIPYATPSMSTVTNISNDVQLVDPGYDAYVFENNLFFSWAATGSVLKTQSLDNSLALGVVANHAASPATLVSVTVASPVIFVSYYSLANGVRTIAYDTTLTPLMATTQAVAAGPTVEELTSIASGRSVTVIVQIQNTYSYDANIKTDYIQNAIVTMPVAGVGAGTVVADTHLTRSVGLASKAFMDGSTIYYLGVYGDTHLTPASGDSNESTYFLFDLAGNVYMRLSATNAGGYLQTQVLPQVVSFNGSYYIPYQITDFLTTVNKGTNIPAGTPTSAIYTQTGINYAIFTLNTTGQYSSEIAGALHLTGGQLWEYDAVKPVEHGFHVYPENVEATPSTTGGTMLANTYYYVFTYEWTDNQGNLQRSAPSIPLKVVTTGSTSSVVLHVPTLRLTYKVSPNPVRIVGYRWSLTQQIYYQFTSVTAPVTNDTTVDSLNITDTSPDSAILGNTLLYTTGGVIENIAAPASIHSCLFNNRVILIDAEDQNLLWYSKQVIQNVPVEFSDLLTIYVAPTTGAQGSTGPMTAVSAMDDKLIIFKRDAIYYITGSGPDNTGANNQFSDPIFITGTVGCSNPQSIVLIPNGIMMQSDKGIWLLGRDLGTTYIGAPVEAFNGQTVLSAEAIPGTNEVRFILDNNVTLSYDYFYDQWSTHTNINAISATLYQGLHTYLNNLGKVFQENIGSYVDGSTPVLLGLTTSWINVAGLQGYERFYFMHLLGTYYSPFKLNVSIGYDYNTGPQQSIIVIPDNYTGPWGAEALWGSGGPWGGIGNVFEARVFPKKQKCESFQITIDESYDGSIGASIGQGLSLSGLILTVGVKKGSRTQSAKRSFG